jgi:hypothetical protein
MIAPVLLSATYNGISVTARWSPVVNPTNPVTGYCLTVYSQQGGQPYQQVWNDPNRTRGTVVITSPLSTTFGYGVQVYAILAGAPNVLSNMPALLTVLPQLTDVTNAGGSLQAGWLPPVQPNIPVTAMQMLLLDEDGNTVQTAEFDAAATAGTMLLIRSLDPARTYFFSAGACAANNITAASTPVQLLATRPTLINAIYNGQSVVAEWTPATGVSPAVTGYSLSVFSQQGGSPSPVNVGPAVTTATITLSAPLPAGQSFYLSVFALAGGSVFSSTGQAPVPLSLPALGNVRYDGSRIDVGWNPVAAPLSAILSYSVFILPIQGSIPFWSRTLPNDGTTEVSIPLPGPLPTGTSYQVFVVADTVGRVSTACAPLTLLTTLPVLQNAFYNGAGIVFNWLPLASPPATVTGYLLIARSRALGAVVSQAVTGASSSTGTLPLFAPLDPSADYSIEVSTTTSNTIDAATIPADLNPIFPVIEAAVNRNNAIFARWTPSTGNTAPISGYMLTLYSNSGYTPQNFVVSNPNAREAVLPVSSFPAQSPLFQVTVMTPGNIQSGLPALAVPVLAPALSAVGFDGMTISAAWTMATATGVTGYRLSLYDGPVLVLEKTVSDLTGDLAFDGVVGVNYQLTVSALSGIFQGPPSTALAVIGGAPSIQSLSYDGATLKVGWSAPANAPGTGYNLAVWQNGQPLPLTGVVYGTLDASVAVVLNGWTRNTVAVQAIATNTAGPFSETAAVVCMAPEAGAASYDGATLALSWPALRGHEGCGYLVTLYQGGTAQTPVYYTAMNSLRQAITLTSNPAWTATVQAVDGVATGPATTPQALIAGTPAIGSAGYDGEAFQASWSAVTDTAATGSLVTLLENGLAVKTVAVTGGGLTTSFRYPVDVANTYALIVQATVAGATGPASTTGPASAVTTIPIVPPVIQTIGYNAGSGTLSVSWAAVTNASAYTLSLFTDDIPVPCTPAYNGAAATVTIQLATTKRYRCTVNAIFSTVTGPACAPEPVISAAPAPGKMGYDGSYLSLEWEPIPDAAVTGYQVQITASDGSQPVTANSATTSARIPVTFTDGLTYSVQVSALGNKATGPWSNSLNPYVVDPAYYFSAFTANVPAFIYRSAVRPPVQGAFNLFLPQLFVTPPSPWPSGLNPGGNSPFQLTATSSPELPYQLSIAATSDAWSFPANTDPIRGALQTDYQAFINALEACSLLPGAIPFLQQLISCAFPLTFAETLYYAYGFNPGSRFVNLQAGMRLRLSFGQYQFTTTQSSLQNGYAGAGDSSYVMGSYLNNGIQDTGFDNFLSQVINQVNPNSGGGSGVLDFYTANLRQPWYRLFYPAAFPSADRAGSVSLQQNIMLLAAPTWTLLDSATSTIIQGGQPPTSVYTCFLRGRVALIPEIQVQLNGQSVWTPVGTSLRNLLDQTGNTTLRAPLNSAGQQVRRAGLMRNIRNTITDSGQAATSYGPGRMNPVAIHYAPVQTYYDGSDYFDLPLLEGDSITLTT